MTDTGCPPPDEGPFSLWLDPAAPPPQPIRLPGKGFTLWLDPACWPVPRLKLPAAGFTIWTAEAHRKQQEHLPAAVPSPAPAAEKPAIFPPDATLPERPAPDSAKVETLSLTGPSAPEPEPPRPSVIPFPVTLPIAMPLITYTQNKAFTLWTRPGLVSPIAMKNGMTAAQLAAVNGAASKPATPTAGGNTPVDRAAAVSESATPSATPVHAPPAEVGTELPVTAAPAPLVAPIPLPGGSHPVAAVPHAAEKWLPVAAALVAILGVHALTRISRDEMPAGTPAKEMAVTMAGGTPVLGAPPVSPPASAGPQAPAPVVSPAPAMADPAAADPAAAGPVGESGASEWQTQAKVLKEQKDLLVTELAGSQQAARKTDARLDEQEKTLSRLTTELNEAKLAAAAAGTSAESSVVTATEEASKIKRESQAAVVELQETLARLEAEKAAAIKSAAESASELATLKAQLEAAAKPAP